MLAGSRCDSLGVRQILGLDLEMFNRHSNVKTLERKEQRRTVLSVNDDAWGSFCKFVIGL